CVDLDLGQALKRTAWAQVAMTRMSLPIREATYLPETMTGAARGRTTSRGDPGHPSSGMTGSTAIEGGALGALSIVGTPISRQSTELSMVECTKGVWLTHMW